MSMSIEETNRVRASLGLAPLETSESIQAENADKEFNEAGEKMVKDVDTGREFVHKPADSWTTKKQQEKMREKLEAAKNKRMAMAKLSAVKQLGAADDNDDAARWVEQMRRKEDEKRLAVERAKTLDTMDDEMTSVGAAARHCPRNPKSRRNRPSQAPRRPWPACKSNTRSTRSWTLTRRRFSC